jgi:protein involved in polysaccharide export with SLBB domain
MSWNRRHTRIGARDRSLDCASALLALLATMLLGTAHAQTPTASQAEAFRNLSPQQQRALMEQMGVKTQGVRRDGALESSGSSDVRPLPMEPEPERIFDAETRLIGGDTLIIEIDPVEFEDQNRILTETPLPSGSGQLEQGGPGSREPPRAAGATGTSDAVAKRVMVDRGASEQARVERYSETVLAANPYRLSPSGSIDLPGLGTVQLAGLTTLQATQRLAIEPYLRDFTIRVTLMPLEPAGRDALKPFGYDLFSGQLTSFMPAVDVPVPSEYVVGPGDRLEVQLVGNASNQYSLVVNRDGRVMFPDLGPIAVAGLSFPDARRTIEERVTQQMIGTTAIVSMGELRSIRIFVLGEANNPGSYTVSGLSTMTNALYYSGGVTAIGSLRDIQLKRGGRIVARLDLYHLLLRGDTSNDKRLQPGDVIFIPPVGKTAGVTGEVRRPAIYEFKGESSPRELISLAGGLTPEADPKFAQLERIDTRQERVVLDVDLTQSGSSEMTLNAGDLLRIQAVKPTYSNSVSVQGHVLRPGSYQFRSGLRLADVIRSVDELKPNADLNYVLIRRELPGNRQVQAVSADLSRAWQSRYTDENPLLSPRDQIFVFDRETGRQSILEPMLLDFRLQAGSSQPSQIVKVSGRVRAPGEYPLEPGMRVSDLVRAGGGLAQDAYSGEAELARYQVLNGETRKTDVLRIDMNRALAGDPAADMLLGPFDLLVVKEISQWSVQEIVRLEGEVKFPGEYPIEPGETLSSVISRAGGLTPLAFAAGSVFTRDTLKEREREQLQLLADRLNQDLGSLALQAAQAMDGGTQQAAETLSIGQSLLNDIRNTEPVGRLVIDLDQIVASEAGSVRDVILKDGDTLRVPKTAQEVTVIGEVQSATSHLFDPDLARDDYIRLSGGTTQKADKSRIYVVRANGRVEAGSGSRWFRGSSEIVPGDTIVVPLDAERMRPLPMWASITTILYNMAIAVAAVNSF